MGDGGGGGGGSEAGLGNKLIVSIFRLFEVLTMVQSSFCKFYLAKL